MAFLLVSAIVATAATPMPACTEPEKAPTADLTAYLEKDRKGLSGNCVEFAIRHLAAVSDQLSITDSERAISALMPYLDFPRTITGKSGRPLDTNWYPARITIVGATNSVVQRLEDAHQDSNAVKQRVLARCDLHRRSRFVIGKAVESGPEALQRQCAAALN